MIDVSTCEIPRYLVSMTTRSISGFLRLFSRSKRRKKLPRVTRGPSSDQLTARARGRSGKVHLNIRG